MKVYREFFNQYFKKFDIHDKNNLDKFHHTYRVMEYSKLIADSLKLNSEDQTICQIIGLFHDIGRFEQWTDYHTYEDAKSIDHGDLSADIIQREGILKEFQKESQEIILSAILFHNKKTIDSNLSDRKKMFCKIIRDANKIDILLERNRIIKEKAEHLPEACLRDLYQRQLCTTVDFSSDIELLLRSIGFIFDFNYTYSLEFIQNKEIIENKFQLLKDCIKDIKQVEELEQFVKLYIKERLHVR